jgi:mannose-1-phosphate guanylyltransferase
MNERSQLITPVILAGGKGTRLWPMSRSDRPKQFLRLTGDLSLYQQTLSRVSDPNRFLPPIVVTNQEYRFLVAEQAEERKVKLGRILLEPIARNTAAAIAVACACALEDAEDRIVFVLPSDHNVVVDANYQCAMDVAIRSALAGRLVTFGIRPTEAATGFGYIAGGTEEPSGARQVHHFVEKPDQEDAERLVATNNYYWNSGMFMFSAETFLRECKSLAPDTFDAATESLRNATLDLDFTRLDEGALSRAPDVPVDIAIFEKTALASVVPAAIQWSDLGSWDAVFKASLKDAEGNVVRGPISLLETRNSIAYSENTHVVVAGMEGAVVIASEDAIYVGKLANSQNVGAVVKALRNSPETLPLTETHLTSYRPWGGYSTALTGDRFQVKRLFVKPGKRLSLQKHHHRSEHWTVVRGTAEVRIGDQVQILRENENAYIPQGEVHRLSNPGKILLELIEVQTGSYLGEDDIIRLEDEFGRQ